MYYANTQIKTVWPYTMFLCIYASVASVHFILTVQEADSVGTWAKQIKPTSRASIVPKDVLQLDNEGKGLKTACVHLAACWVKHAMRCKGEIGFSNLSSVAVQAYCQFMGQNVFVVLRDIDHQCLSEIYKDRQKELAGKFCDMFRMYFRGAESICPPMPSSDGLLRGREYFRGLF